MLSALLVCAFVPSIQAQHIFEVDTWNDEQDLLVGDGICETALGDCSLRAAIEEANATPNSGTADRILFSGIPVLDWFAMIEIIDDPLPAITEKVIIDATTAPGDVILEGSQIVGWASGLVLEIGSGGSTIRGLSIGSFSVAGLYVNSNYNKIEQNNIGMLSDGSDYGNSFGMIVYGSNNMIGGPLKGNVIGFSANYGISGHKWRRK